MIPGFKESHGHLLGIGHAKLNVDLVGTKSYQELVDRVAAAVKSRKPGEWVVGPRLARGQVDGHAQPHRARLSHAPSRCPPSRANNPVYLTRADGHAGFANARAMEAMGVARDTRPPEGGEIIKDAEGKPSGIFVDRAQALIEVPPPSAAQQRRAFDARRARVPARRASPASTTPASSWKRSQMYKERASQRTPCRCGCT